VEQADSGENAIADEFGVPTVWQAQNKITTDQDGNELKREQTWGYGTVAGRYFIPSDSTGLYSAIGKGIASLFSTSDNSDLSSYGGTSASGTSAKSSVIAPYNVMSSTKYPITVGGGTVAQENDVIKDMAAIFGTSRGQQLEAKYSQQNPLNIDITNGTTGAYPNSNNVFIDLSYHPDVQTTDGWIPSSSLRILAHETGHAATGTHDDGPGQMNNVNQNENPIMQQLGQPARISYPSRP
jgi:hypothetical protein